MFKVNYSSRYLEILAILRKNSLIKKFNRAKNILNKLELESKEIEIIDDFAKSFRVSLEEMGPSFVKFGQMLSTRSDLLHPRLIAEFQGLQDNVAAFDSGLVKKVIEEQYNMEFNQIFESFEDQPFAQGSIAQVHRATLRNGDKLAVKVQRPGIKDSISLDVEILESLVKRFNSFVKINNVVNLVDLVDEFKLQIFREIDFEKEAKNLLRFREQNRDDKYVFTPRLYEEFLNKKVIVMEYIDAKSIKTLPPDIVKEHGEEIANRLIYSFANQVFEHGYFHADPHPGNLLIDDELNPFLTDFGIVGNLSDKNKYSLLKLFMGISLNSTRIILAAIIELGALGKDVNTSEFEREAGRFLDKYMKLSLNEIKLSSIFNNFFSLLYKYEIKIDRSLLMLGKTLLILEGLIEFLDEESSLLELSKPIARKLFKRFVSFDYAKNYFLNSTVDALELMTILPRGILDFSRKMEENAYVFKHAHKEDDEIIKLKRGSLRQKQLNIFLILASLIFLVSFIMLSSVKELKYQTLWKALAIADGILAAGFGLLLLYRFFKNN